MALENEASRIAREQAPLATGDPHGDPNAEFPRPGYFNSSNISYAARGADRHELWLGGSVDGLPLDMGQPVRSLYPYNQVQETLSGHSIELDDTPGGERVLIRHNTGSGVELRSDGTVVISSKSSQIQVAGGDQTVIIDGEANLVYRGNLNMKVTGDFNLDVAGNYNVNVNGNRTSNITGSDRRNINGAVGDIVRGGMSTTSKSQVTNTFLGGMSNNVKGTYSNNVNGDANYLASGDTTITSQSGFLIAADDAVVSANAMDIKAATGNWGGESVKIGAQGALFSEGVTAPTFHGDLDGTATTSTVTQSQNYGEASTGSAGSITDTATPSGITVPTAASQSTNLASSSQGTRRVLIDEGDFIAGFIDRTQSYGGVSSAPVSTNGARSRLRDPGNRNNSTFTNQLLADETVCPEYIIPAPEGVGRIIEGGETPSAGDGAVGSGINPATAYVPRHTDVTLIPELQFNPYFNSPITASTRLNVGITVAKFLGSDDPTNFDFIRDQKTRTSIACYWYLHTLFIRDISEDTGDFKDYRLEVAEGLYRPGPDETITPGSINDLKMKGRAVVYKLTDSQGRVDNTKTFDLAARWKDTMYYDQMILSYDTIDCALHARLIIVLPEIDADWKGNYRRQVWTEYNNNKLSQGELVECLPFQSSIGAVSNPSDIQLGSGGDYGVNLGASEFGPPLLVPGPNVHPETSITAATTLQSLLDNQYARMQEYYGGPLRINDALPNRRTSRTPPSRGGGSQHWFGKALDISTAGMSTGEKDRLVVAAVKAGFTGFGFGVGILHIDIGTPRQWDYGNSTFGSRNIFGRGDTWVKYLNQNRRG